jgi:hypothetical protein
LDAKEFPIHYLAVIDQLTGECRITKADVETRNTVWVTRENQEMCYSVLRSQFIPLKKWVFNHSYLLGTYMHQFEA